MIYGIIRIVIFVFICTIFIKLIQKHSKTKKKFFNVMAIVISMLLLFMSFEVPIENLFVTFKTPEDVFKYSRIGTVKYIIEGKESCMMIYSQNNDNLSTSTIIIPKGNNGYKIGTSNSYRLAYMNSYTKGSIMILNFNDSLDFYAVITGQKTNPKVEISDNQRSIFKIQENGDWLDAYAYINDFSDKYILSINGEEIEIT